MEEVLATRKDNLRWVGSKEGLSGAIMILEVRKPRKSTAGEE